MVTIINEQRSFEVATAGPGLVVGAADLARVTGFELKPEGLCRDAICVPVPRGEAAFVDAGGAIDLARFWRHIGNPVVHDETGEVWVLGVGAEARARTLETFEAPDFTLPDLEGRLHALSAHRGRRVVLATWASW